MSKVPKSVIEYRVLLGDFGEDGLISMHSCFKTANIEEAWIKFIDVLINARNYDWLSPIIYGYASKNDDDYQMVYSDEINRWEPSVPDWVKNELNKPRK